jgi:predicted transcriptional regulator
MGQVYLLTFPVSDKQEARNLGSSSAWEVLEELRDVGLDGLTVEEISKKLELPKSTVYGVLSKLQAAGWVEPRRSLRKLGRPNAKRKEETTRTGRMKQIYVEKIPWGDIEFDDEFKDVLGPAITRVFEKHETVELFVDAIDRILANLALGEKSRKFLPSRELCPKCKTSHEAYEFLQAICIGLTSVLLSNEFSNKIKPVLEKHGVKAFSAN